MFIMHYLSKLLKKKMMYTCWGHFNYILILIREPLEMVLEHLTLGIDLKNKTVIEFYVKEVVS